MGRDEELARTAESRHGIVSRSEASAAGLDRFALRRRLQGGSLKKTGLRGFRLRGSPETDLARAIAAVIETPGTAYLSHTSAAWLWELPGFRLDPIHVSRTYEGTRRPSRSDRVHNLRGVPQSQLGEFKAIPVGSPALTLFQLAAICHPLRTERAVDNALSMGIADLTTLHSLLKRLAARGRNGIRTMRSILVARPPGFRPVESGNERRFHEIARFLGIEVERQVNIGGEHAFITRVDFRDVKYPHLIYRIQSARWHSARSHREDDASQRSSLEKAGFTVLDIWDRDLWGNRAEVERQVIRARTDTLAGR